MKLAALVSCVLLTNLGAQEAPKLIINIVEGEGALNNVKQRVNREPIVQVEDENHKPIAGAAVVFFLPTTGPGGTFANGSQTLTVTTDSLGRAAAKGIVPNHQTGQMQIRVTAVGQRTDGQRHHHANERSGRERRRRTVHHGESADCRGHRRRSRGRGPGRDAWRQFQRVDVDCERDHDYAPARPA